LIFLWHVHALSYHSSTAAAMFHAVKISR
jgi:hypothetical protein